MDLITASILGGSAIIIAGIFAWTLHNKPITGRSPTGNNSLPDFLDFKLRLEALERAWEDHHKEVSNKLQRATMRERRAQELLESGELEQESGADPSTIQPTFPEMNNVVPAGTSRDEVRRQIRQQKGRA